MPPTIRKIFDIPTEQPVYELRLVKPNGFGIAYPCTIEIGKDGDLSFVHCPGKTPNAGIIIIELKEDQ